MGQSAIDAALLRRCALFLAAVLLIVLPRSVTADATVEVPVLAVIQANNQGVFNVMVLKLGPAGQSRSLGTQMGQSTNTGQRRWLGID